MIIAELFLTYYSRFFRLWLTPSPSALIGLPRLLVAFRSFPLFGLIVLESHMSRRIAVSFAVTFSHSCWLMPRLDRLARQQ
jgi:hypothetical protein